MDESLTLSDGSYVVHRMKLLLEVRRVRRGSEAVDGGESIKRLYDAAKRGTDPANRIDHRRVALAEVCPEPDRLMVKHSMTIRPGSIGF